MIPTIMPFLKGYNGNLDFQLVSALTKDLEPMKPLECYMEWVERLLTEELKELEIEDGTKRKKAEDKRLKRMDAYLYLDCMNSALNCIVIGKYMCGYACKSEISPSDATKILRRMVLDECLEDDTQMATVARKYNCQINKAREVGSAEAVHLLCRFPMVQSTMKVQRVKHPGKRIFKKTKQGQIAEQQAGRERVNKSGVDNVDNVDKVDDAMEDDDDSDGDDDVSVKENHFDKYMKTMRAEIQRNKQRVRDGEQDVPGPGDLPTFDQHMNGYDPEKKEEYQVQSRKIFPMYNFGSKHPVYPLNEAHSKFLCGLHTPGMTKTADLLAIDDEEFETCLDKIKYMDREKLLPVYVIEGLRRAFLLHQAKSFVQKTMEKKSKKGGKKKKESRERKKHSQIGMDPGAFNAESFDQDEKDEEDEFFQSIFDRYENGGQVGDEHEAINDEHEDRMDYADPGYKMEDDHDDDDDLPPVEYPQDVWQVASEHFDRIKSSANAVDPNLLTLPRMSHERYVDPCLCLDNEGQRYFLCRHLKHIEESVKADASISGYEHPPENIRQILVGSAGTGKTFIIHLNRCFYRLAYDHQNAEVSVAPTGVAAGGVGGLTIDSAFTLKRNQKNFCSIAENKLLAKQVEFGSTKCIHSDERSMVGRNMAGQYWQRLDDVLNHGNFDQTTDSKGYPSFGGLRAFVHAGDDLQLPPVMDKCNYGPSTSNEKNAVCCHGLMGYQRLRQDSIALDQKMRQNNKDKFGKMVDACRDPEQMRNDRKNILRFWNTRAKLSLSEWKRSLFDIEDNTTLFLSSTRREVTANVREYLLSRKNVLTFTCRAEGSTTHNDGMIKSVARRMFVSLHGLVKLTINVAPGYGLYHHAPGSIKGVLYPDQEAGYPGKDADAIILVDFPGYTGPPAFIGAPPTWVAVSKVKRQCETCQKCERIGFPLVCGKADTIHCAQGITAGGGTKRWSIKTLDDHVELPIVGSTVLIVNNEDGDDDEDADENEDQDQDQIMFAGKVVSCDDDGKATHFITCYYF